jgi:predicted naringenin-chalcone synthase
MPASILALGSAVPQYEMAQHEIAERIIALLRLEGEQGEELRKLYKNSAIKKRYSVLPDFQGKGELFDSKGPPGMSKRNAIYKQEAPLLGKKAALTALEAWGGDKREITHLLSVSCTGVVAPGIEFALMQALDLDRSIQRFGINMMGCFGAFKALALARAFVQENSSYKVLIVCTELCTLHFQADMTSDKILGNALFGDGAAAAVIGCAAKGFCWEIHKSTSMGIDETLNKMTWEASDDGFLMKLSTTVPVRLQRAVPALVPQLLGERISVEDCDWAVHPGGKAIVQAIEKALGLKKEQTQASWNTLVNYGNMSSATFLFVLEEMQKQTALREWCAGIGFGPGLSIEGILLRRGGR